MYTHDPKVKEEIIKQDLQLLRESRGETEASIAKKLKQVNVPEKKNEVFKDSHAVAVLTEWDEFNHYNWNTIYNQMLKPAFVFDGSRILDKQNLE